MDKVIYEINGKKFAVTEKTFYIQYKKINDLLKEFDIDKTVEIAEDGNKQVNILEVVKQLMNKDLIPTALTIILSPLDESGNVVQWNETFMTSYLDDMQYVTDVQLMEILKSFFTLKIELIQSITNYFQNSTNTN